MACEDETTLLRYVAGTLDAELAARVEAHLDGCADCRQLVAVAAKAAQGGAQTQSVETTPEGPGARERQHVEAEAGAVIGRYRLLERIGGGGMGVVWAAYDPRLHRKVALKLIRKSHDEETDTRILREAQAMAQLSHVNVVTVHDAGTYAHGSFIAMELVEGTTLRRWLATPRSWREVLAVLLDAGRGLAAAHAVGLVHRDFKPDNVLIGGDGKVQVGDFGLVRLAPGRTSSGAQTPLTAQVTRQGTLLGTAGYLAPELLGDDGVATGASDQFSFCVTLYEGLYGAMPFPGASMVDSAVNAKEGRLLEPPASARVPRRLLELLRRGLAAEPGLRFGSMAELLERLADDPTPRRRALAAAAAATVLVVAGLGAWSWQRATACDAVVHGLDGVWDEARAERARLAFVATGKPWAADAWAKTRRRLDAYAAAWLGARLEACAAQSAPRAECLEQRRDELDALARAFESADATVPSFAGTAVAELSSLESCRSAERPPGPRWDDSLRALERELLRARTLLYTGQHARAAEAVTPVLERAQALKAPLLVAESARVLGEAQRGLSQEACLETWQLGARAAAEAGDDALLLRLLSHLIAERGWQRGKPDEARALVPLAEGIARRLQGHDRAVGRLLAAQSDVEWQDGHPQLALALLKQALDRFRREPGEDSLDAARARAEMGWMLMELGQLPAARDEMEKARAIREQVWGENSPSMYASWSYLSGVLQEQGDFPAAATAAAKALALSEAESKGSALVAPLLNLAQVYGQLGRGSEALALLDRADALIAADASKAHRRADALIVRIVVERGLGHAAKSIEVGEQALEAIRVSYRADHPLKVEALYELALSELAAGKHGDSAGHLKAALELQDAAKEVRRSQRARLLSASGRAALGLGQDAHALPQLVTSVALFDELQSYDPLECGKARLALADAQWKLGELTAARETALAARERLKAAGDTSVAKVADDWLAAHVR